MRGFDRPLRPEWIYRFLLVVEPGDYIKDHNKDFGEILWQLDGKEGKRKVRTIISRYYFRTSTNEKGKRVEDLFILHLCKKHTLEEIQPILLYHLLLRAPILEVIRNMIIEIYGEKKRINYQFLRKKIIEKMGERDISSRSLRNFISTLINFDVMERIKEDRNSVKLSPISLNERNMIYAIYDYANEKVRGRRISVEDFEKTLTLFFEYPEIEKIIMKYNNYLWSYKVMINRRYIYLKVPAEKIDDIIKEAFKEG
jgi:hypothetical protein